MHIAFVIINNKEEPVIRFFNQHEKSEKFRATLCRGDSFNCFVP